MKKLKLKSEVVKRIVLRDIVGGAPDDMETIICTLGRACDKPSDLCVTKDCTEHGC
jgi:hypothetical protein